MDHLARNTGKRVQFFAVQSNAAQIEAMRAGRLHVAGFNTGSAPLAVNCAGFAPFSMMASRDGRLFAFTAQTSNSGDKPPSALLESAFCLRAERDFRTAFSGRHDNSIIGVASRDYDAAAIANSGLIPDLIEHDLRPLRAGERPNGRRRSCGEAKRADARAGD